jgi:long-chain acyl-CoA synthetase
MGVKSGLTEDVHAVIVPSRDVSPGTEPGEVRKSVQRELQELARELPSYQRLQAIHIWSAPLPRDEEGKLNRAALREWVQDQVAGEGKAVAVPARESSRRETLYSELGRLSGLEIAEITEETSLYTDLGLDSLMAVELLLFIERSLGVTVSDERAAMFQTVGDVLDELRRRGAGPTPDGMAIPSRTYRSSLPYGERPALDRALMGVSFSALKQLFKRYFRLRVSNSEVLPRGEALIIAANHSSHLDSAAVIAAISLALGVNQAQRVHIIGARDYFFDSPFKSWLFTTCLNVVPIERDEIGLSGLRMVGSILTAGEPVLIFPEGTRSRTGRLQEFKPGVGLLAWEYQVPVIPAYIAGAFAAMPPGSNVPRRRGIEVRFGRPVAMADYADRADGVTRDELYRRIAGDLRRAVADLAEGPPGRAGEAEEIVGSSASGGVRSRP